MIGISEIEPGTALQLLNVFVGTWKTEGELRGGDGRPTLSIVGTDTYQWVAGGFFLQHIVDVWIGNERNETIEIIGFDPSTGKYPMYYFDNKGNKGQMEGSFDRGIWSVEGKSLNFNGGFSEDGCVLSGTWEQLVDGKWETFMDIKLVKS